MEQYHLLHFKIQLFNLNYELECGSSLEASHLTLSHSIRNQSKQMSGNFNRQRSGFSLETDQRDYLAWRIPTTSTH